jgi:hypothetical protein
VTRILVAAALVFGLGAAPAVAPGHSPLRESRDQIARQLVKERREHATERRRLLRLLRHRPSVREALALASVVYGVPRAQLDSVAQCESTQKAWARNGRYRGLFQQGPMFERSPFGRAGLSVWSPYVAALSTAYTVTREGWQQWECSPHGAFQP